MLSLRAGVAAGMANEHGHHAEHRRRSRFGTGNAFPGSPRLSGSQGDPGTAAAAHSRQPNMFLHQQHQPAMHSTEDYGLMEHFSPDFKRKHGAAVQEMLNTSAGNARLYAAKARHFSAKSAPMSLLRRSTSHGPGSPADLQASACNWRHPLSVSRITFDVFISVLTLYSILMIPWALGFDISLEDKYPGLYYFDFVIDAFFITDMILRFFSWSITHRNALDKDCRSNAMKYLKSWFIVDFVSSVPFDIIVHMAVGLNKTDVRTLKLVRTARLTKLLKLLRFARLRRITASITRRTIILNRALIRLLKLLFSVVFMAHLLSCLWAYVSYSPFVNGDGEFVPTWVEPLPGFRVDDTQTELSMYIASTYYVVSTMLAVGYGDIQSQNNGEKFVSILIMLAGAAFFGVMIANVNAILEALNGHNWAISRKMNELKAYMIDRKFPKALQLRIRQYYRYFLSRTAVSNEQVLLSEMSSSLRNDIIAFTYSKVISRLTCLHNLERSVISDLVAHMRPQFALPHDVIAKQGEAASAMYYCVKGTVEVTVQDPLYGINVAALIANEAVPVTVTKVPTQGRLPTVGEDTEETVRTVTLPGTMNLAEPPGVARRNSPFYDPRLALKLYGSPFAKKHQPATRLKRVIRAMRAMNAPQLPPSTVPPSTDTMSVESNANVEAIDHFSMDELGNGIRPSDSSKEKSAMVIEVTDRKEDSKASYEGEAEADRSTDVPPTATPQRGEGNSASSTFSSKGTPPAETVAASSEPMPPFPGYAPGKPPVFGSRYGRRDSISRGAQSTHSFVIGLYTDGTDFGEVELLQGARRAVGFRAASVLDLQSVSREHIWELAETHPKFRVHFVNQAKERSEMYKKAVKDLTDSLLKEERTLVASARKKKPALQEKQPKLLKRSITGTEALSKGHCAETVLLNDKPVAAALLPEGLLAPDSIGESRDNLLRTLRLAVIAQRPMLVRNSCAWCKTAARVQWLLLCGCRCGCCHGRSEVEKTSFYPPYSPSSHRDIRRSNSSRPQRVGRGCCQTEDTYATPVEDVESAKDLMKRWILAEDFTLKVAWDILLVLAILTTMIQIPFVIGFSSEGDDARNLVERVVDAIFAVDLLLQFRVAYMDPQDDFLVTVPSMIARRYLKTGFLLDFLSTFPFDWVVGSFLTNNVAELRSLKLVRVTRLVRLLKLARLFRLSRAMRSISNTLLCSPSVTKLLALLLQASFCAHVIGCLWHFVGDVSDHGWTSQYTVGTSTWDRYLSSLYWAFATIATVGYGDVVPVNTMERAYVIFSMIVGATMFGYIVGSIAAHVGRLRVGAARMRERMDEVAEYVREQRLPRALARRVTDYYRQYLKRKSAFDEDRILGELSESLRREVLLFLNEDLVNSIPFFSDLDDSFTSHVVSLLRPQFYSPGEYVFREGDEAFDMYFLSKGEVEVVRNEETPEEVTVSSLSSGGYFGEFSLLLGIRRSVTVRAVTDCSLFALSRDDLRILVETYPSLGYRLESTMKDYISSAKEHRIPLKHARLNSINRIIASKSPVQPWLRAHRERPKRVAQVNMWMEDPTASNATEEESASEKRKAEGEGEA